MRQINKYIFHSPIYIFHIEAIVDHTHTEHFTTDSKINIIVIIVIIIM